MDGQSFPITYQHLSIRGVPEDSRPGHRFITSKPLQCLLLLCMTLFFVQLDHIFKFLYFWLQWVFIAALAFSGCIEQGLLFIVVRRLLIEVISLVAEHGLQFPGLEQLEHTDLVAPRPMGSPQTGIEPVFPALAGRFLTTGLPGMSRLYY